MSDVDDEDRAWLSWADIDPDTPLGRSLRFKPLEQHYLESLWRRLGELRTALAEAPDDVELLLATSAAEEDGGLPEEAVRLCDRVLALAPPGSPQHEEARTRRERLLARQR